jgi:hypothetical protein
MVFAVMLIASVAEAAHPAFAQKAPTAKQKAAVVFSRLIERWQKSDDPKETIAALELALKLEPTIAAWPWTLPIRGSREPKLGGTVQVWIAYSTRISCAKVWPAIRLRSARCTGPLMGMPVRQGKTWKAHRVGSLRRVHGIHSYRSAE